MIEFDKGKSEGPLEPGTYRKINPFNAVLCCPDCGETGGLDHEIDNDGTVTPSLVCPNDGCSFHEMVKLKDWE